MKFICIIGDSAVGKMTVGQELAKLTGLSLFHNHMAIELVLDVFKSYDTSAIEAVRQAVYQSFVQTELPGIIITLQLAFELEEDIDYLNKLTQFFERHGATAYIVELDATFEERLKRNKTENRLNEKASKRDVLVSEERLINDYHQHRCISEPGEITHKHFMRIDNTQLSAQETAQKIVDYFHL